MHIAQCKIIINNILMNINKYTINKQVLYVLQFTITIYVTPEILQILL